MKNSRRTLWFVVAAFTIVIPLFVSPAGADVFRLPKELLVRAEAIAILAIAALSLVWRPRSWRDFLVDRSTVIALAAIVVATAIAAIASTNRAISAGSVVYTFALIIGFCGAYAVNRRRPVATTILIASASAVPNALLAIAQRLGIYNPFDFPADIPHRMRTTALIGNPNDVGAALAVCFVAVLAVALVRKSWIAIAMAALILAGVLASDALTAVLAVTVSLALALVIASRRVGLSAVAAFVLVGVATLLVLPPLRARTRAMVASARAGDLDALTSHRIVGYLTALKIFRDRPLAGSGPGTFEWLYLPNRLQVESDHPELYLKMTQNIGEVHSDHLQVLAEEGIIGYAAMLAAVIALGSRTFVRKGAGENARIIRITALPLAACFVTLAATGFPLELSAVMAPLLFFTACCMVRRDDEAAA